MIRFTPRRRPRDFLVKKQLSSTQSSPPQSVNSPTLRTVARISRWLGEHVVPISTRHPHDGRADGMGAAINADPRVIEATVTKSRTFGASPRLTLRLVLAGKPWGIDRDMLVAWNHSTLARKQSDDQIDPGDPSNLSDTRSETLGNLNPIKQPSQSTADILAADSSTITGSPTPLSPLPPELQQFVRECAKRAARPFATWGRMQIMLAIRSDDMQWCGDATAAGFPTSAVTPATLNTF